MPTSIENAAMMAEPHTREELLDYLAATEKALAPSETYGDWQIKKDLHLEPEGELDESDVRRFRYKIDMLALEQIHQTVKDIKRAIGEISYIRNTITLGYSTSPSGKKCMLSKESKKYLLELEKSYRSEIRRRVASMESAFVVAEQRDLLSDTDNDLALRYMPEYR